MQAQEHRRGGRRKKRAHAAGGHVPAIVNDRKNMQQYSKGRLLGTGGFAKCFVFTEMFGRGRSLAGKVVAKSSLTKSRAKQKLIAEIKIHRSLRHRHVVQFIHFFEDKRNVYIILELCEHRSLMDLVKRRKRLTEPEVRYYMVQMLDALRYMHGKNVIHRDMKLGNLFLSREMEIRVGDFGLATQLASPDEKRKTICGTPNYIAPEILDNRSDGHSFEVDIWSLGVIMYTMLVGKPPFETKDVKSTYKRIRANAYSFPASAGICEHAESLIRWILHTRPERRPTLGQIRAHPFFSRHGALIPVALPESALRAAPSVGLLQRRSESSTSETAQGQRSSTGTQYEHRCGPPGPQTSAQRSCAIDTRTELGAQSATVTRGALLCTPGSPQSNEGRFHPRGGNGVQFKSPPNPRGKENDAASREGSDCPKEVHVRAEDAHVKDTGAGCQHCFAEQLGDDVPPGQTRESVQPMNVVRGAKIGTSGAQRHGHRGDNELKGRGARVAGGAPARCPILQTMHRKIQMSFAAARGEHLGDGNGGQSPSTMAQKLARDDSSKAWVVRWVDYTSKYGMGYLLNDGSIGVYFNDSTKIILAPVGNAVEYITRSHLPLPSEKGATNIPDQPPRQKHTMTEYPKTLHKKVTLLRHFRNYLTEQQQKHGAKLPGQLASILYGNGANRIPVKELTFVKKWVRTRHAIFFRLSNRTVQVSFFDRTEIVLSSGARIITYLDKTGKRETRPLVEVLNNSRPDIAKRLKYTKDILHQLICGLRK